MQVDVALVAMLGESSYVYASAEKKWKKIKQWMKSGKE